MGGSLQGQVAVVTGASGGLGAHFAHLLASEGASVALTARRLDKVEALAGELAGQGHRAMALRLDVSDADTIGPALDEIEAGLGPVSILVNKAGVGGDGLALDISVEGDLIGRLRSQCARDALLRRVRRPSACWSQVWLNAEKVAFSTSPRSPVRPSCRGFRRVAAPRPL